MSDGDRAPATWRTRILRRAVELVIVFVGVYAAFLLNSYYDERKEAQRRAQLVDWLIEDYSRMLAELRKDSVSLARENDSFKAEIAAGKTPAPNVLVWASTDYDPTEKTMLLGSGALNLLKVSTLRQLTEVEATLRQSIFILRHDQQLSDTLILPHLGETPSPFYDPMTKQLRPEYEWYQRFFEREIQLEKSLEPQIEKLIELLKAERAAN